MCCQVFQTILLCLIKAQSWLIQNYSLDYFWENCFWDYFSGATGHHDHSISAHGREAGTGGSLMSLLTHIIPWFFSCFVGAHPMPEGWNNSRACGAPPVLKPGHWDSSKGLIFSISPGATALHPSNPNSSDGSWWAAGGAGFPPVFLLAQEGYHWHMSPFC